MARTSAARSTCSRDGRASPRWMLPAWTTLSNNSSNRAFFIFGLRDRRVPRAYAGPASDTLAYNGSERRPSRFAGAVIRQEMLLELIAAVHLSVGTCREVTLRPLISRDGCETSTSSASYTRCSFGNRDLSARINQLIEQRVREAARYEEPSDLPPGGSPENCPEGDRPHESHSDARCDRPFQRRDVLSFRCGSSWDGGAHPDGAPFAINLRVTSDRYREIKLRDLLVDDEAEARLWTLVRNDLLRQLGEVYHDDAFATDEWMAERLQAAHTTYRSFNLSSDGLVISFDHYAFGYAVLDSTIPYPLLREILPASLLTPDGERRRPISRSP